MRKAKQHKHNEPAARELDPSERFPFRATCPEDRPIVRERMERAIRNNRGILLDAARRVMEPWKANFDDLVQELSVQTIKALPRYDKTRGAAVSSFVGMVVYPGARRVVMAMWNRSHRRPDQAPMTDELLLCVGEDDVADIDAAVRGLLATPERWLTRLQSRVLVEVYYSCGETKESISKRIGFAHPSSLSSAIRHIRRRFDPRREDAIDLAELVAAAPAIADGGDVALD